jgi:hypothetical protein
MSREYQPGTETESGIRIGGWLKLRMYLPDGKTLIHEAWAKNGVPSAALTHILATELGAGTQVTTWYGGIIDNAGFSALATNDTMASHAGWNEITAYSEATRPALTFGAASGGSIQTSSVYQFTASSTLSIKGAFIVSNNTKGGGTGTLFATGTFSSVQTVTSGIIFKLDYVCSATSA